MSSFNTILALATYLEARGARKKLESSVAGTHAQLDVALREENARSRAIAMRQTMFEARLQLIEIEKKTESQPVMALYDLLDVRPLIDRIDADFLTELSDKEYLLKLKHMADSLEEILSDRLPSGTANKLRRHEVVRTLVAPQTRSYALACAAIEYFHASDNCPASVECRDSQQTGWAHWLVTAGIFFVSLNFLSLFALLPVAETIEGYVFLASFCLSIWIAYKFHSRNFNIFSENTADRNPNARRAPPSPHWLARPQSIPQLQALAQRMLMDENFVNSIGQWRYGEMIASRDEAIRALQNSPDALQDSRGTPLSAQAAEARFHALVEEIANLEVQLSKIENLGHSR